MSKVGRAGVRDSTKGAGSRRKAKPKNQPGANKAANWAAAQVRAARNRASYALRLGALTAGLLFALTLGVLAVLGRLGDAGGSVMAAGERQLTRAGYTVTWLDVSGANRLDAATIASLIGAEGGAGLAEINLAEARAVLESQSWIKSAQVLRLWPDRIAVLVTERAPVALWQLDGEHRVIDADGVVIEAADPAEFTTLPRVVGVGANTGAARITALIAGHPEIASRTTHVIKVGERRWSLRLEQGGEVLLPEDDPAGALAMLAALHDERAVLDYDVQFLDLRNDGEMVIRPWPDRAEGVEHTAGRGA
ncbi:MAG: FtsQ-type POTRA domain-containing protein [Oceanicaulis sp.]